MRSHPWPTLLKPPHGILWLLSSQRSWRRCFLKIRSFALAFALRGHVGGRGAPCDGPWARPCCHVASVQHVLAAMSRDCNVIRLFVLLHMLPRCSIVVCLRCVFSVPSALSVQFFHTRTPAHCNVDGAFNIYVCACNVYIYGHTCFGACEHVQTGMHAHAQLMHMRM